MGLIIPVLTSGRIEMTVETAVAGGQPSEYFMAENLNSGHSTQGDFLTTNNWFYY
jgi:hypothetical protein